MKEKILSRRIALQLTGGAIAAFAAASSISCAAANDRRQTIRERIAARREQSQGTDGSSSDNGLTKDRITDPWAQSGRFGVETALGEFADKARSGRVVPWKAYLPAGTATAPLVIYSPGGGGTRETGSAYGQHLASHGIASLHLQHAGSDRDAFRSDPQQISAAARDPARGKPRFEDIAFALREIERGAGGLGRLDATRAGVAGHSLGAITTLIVAGQSVKGFGQSFGIRTLKGAFALSPSPPRPEYGDASTAFDAMFAPIFHLTGTEDDAPNGDFKAPARRIPFDETSNVDQRLLILKGANHFTFGGDANPQLRGQSFGYPGLERHHDLIKAAAASFWSARLLGDANAQTFLESGLKALLGAGDTLEAKAAR